MVEWVNGVGSGRGYSISDQRGSFPPDKEEERGGGAACNQPRLLLEERTAAAAAAAATAIRHAEDSASFMEIPRSPGFSRTASRHLHFSDYAFICMRKAGISPPSAAPRGWRRHRLARIACCDVSNCV